MTTTRNASGRTRPSPTRALCSIRGEPGRHGDTEAKPPPSTVRAMSYALAEVRELQPTHLVLGGGTKSPNASSVHQIEPTRKGEEHE